MCNQYVDRQMHERRDEQKLPGDYSNLHLNITARDNKQCIGANNVEANVGGVR